MECFGLVQISPQYAKWSSVVLVVGVVLVVFVANIAATHCVVYPLQSKLKIKT